MSEAPVCTTPVVLQVDNIFIDNDGLTASVAELLTVDLSLFLTNIEGLPWDSTSFGQSQKEQKDHSSHANGTVNTSTAHTHSASAAWMHSSVQSGSAGSGDGPGGVQHPSIISTYCPQVLVLLRFLLCHVLQVLCTAKGALHTSTVRCRG